MASCSAQTSLVVNSIYRFADATAVGQISDNDETEFGKEIENLVAWCEDNNLALSGSRMRLVSDHRKWGGVEYQSVSMVLEPTWPRAHISRRKYHQQFALDQPH